MKFDTTKGDCLLGIFLVGSGFAFSLATAIMILVNDPYIVVPASITLIVAAIIYLMGVLLIFMNSKGVGDKQVDESASFLVTGLFVIATITMAIAGILVSL
ncbi:MAG: hypothetical protein ACTSRU_18215 [Candidatus Hodarchaeales archaeon]